MLWHAKKCQKVTRQTFSSSGRERVRPSRIPLLTRSMEETLFWLLPGHHGRVFWTHTASVHQSCREGSFVPLCCGISRSIVGPCERRSLAGSLGLPHMSQPAGTASMQYWQGCWSFGLGEKSERARAEAPWSERPQSGAGFVRTTIQLV